MDVNNMRVDTVDTAELQENPHKSTLADVRRTRAEKHSNPQ